MPPPTLDHGIDYTRRHLRFGWWSLLLFATLGFALEALHGFKVRAYLDVSNDTRRLMWTLAHAHGTLLSFLHLIFAATLRLGVAPGHRDLPTISWCLVGASILLPIGFFVGGLNAVGGDPGLGILLVPVGAALLLFAIVLIARAAGSKQAGR